MFNKEYLSKENESLSARWQTSAKRSSLTLILPCPQIHKLPEVQQQQFSYTQNLCQNPQSLLKDQILKKALICNNYWRAMNVLDSKRIALAKLFILSIKWCVLCNNFSPDYNFFPEEMAFV